MAPPTLTRRFIWTIIPAGRVQASGSESVALFSLLLTPRLLGPIGARLTVADFGMQAWPQRLVAARFEFLRATRPIAARQVPLVTADGRQITFTMAQQLSAWKALFPSAMLVRPFTRTSYTARPVEEFPAHEAGAEISGMYGSSARALAQVGQDGLRVGYEAPTAVIDEGSALRKAYKFYRRDADSFTPLAPLTGIAGEEHDFHDVVARLADHPVLLRALGLLIDFATPVGPLTVDTGRELRAVVSWDAAATPPAGWLNATQEDLSPRTAYAVTASRFVPAAAAPPHGLLPLAGTGAAVNGRFEIIPFDVDGAALRLVSVTESDRSDLSIATDGPRGLPTLRSVGFALVDKARGSDHTNRLTRADQRATADGLLGSALTADNLIAGYRVDIFDEKTQEWRSLCQRRVRYEIGDLQIGLAEGALPEGLLEEGYVRLDSLTTGAGAADAVYIHQTVARWDGWSLVVARPERVTDPVTVSPSAVPPFGARVDLEPGSLPRLRFGRSYRLRVRLADLAGGGLRADQVGPTEEQTEPFTHRRFEPIPAPEVAPTRAYGDGDGQHQIVIRSDRGVSAEAYAAAHGYRAFDLRHLLPPRSSLELAVQHQRTFDAALGPQAASSEVTRFFEIARRADRDLKDIAGAVAESGEGAGTYFVLPETPVDMPWLADPGSTLASIIARPRPIDPDTGKPGTIDGFADAEGRMKLFPWKGPWPNLVPIALRVTAATAGCTASMALSGARRTLTIALGPAAQVTLDIVSCPSLDDVTALGIANWAGATSTPSDPIAQHVYRGRNPMVTPPRTITLVHAVQRPLRDPGGRLLPQRNVGDTHVLLDPVGDGGERLELTLDVPSTGRIDLRAAWKEIVDVPSRLPTREPREAIVGSYDIKHEPLYMQSQIRQEFGDTRRRRVTHKVTAVSRFRDYFGRITTANPQACTVEGVLEVTDIPSSARPPAPTLRYLMPTFRWLRQGEGTAEIVSKRRGGGLRAFLERPWFVSGEDEALAVIAWPLAATPSAAALRHLSLAGRDPTWDTGSPAAVLTPGHFAAASSAEEFLRECARTVSAVVHPIRVEDFDKEADCWCVDIDLSPLVESSYFPFVRLALARYQEHSVDPADRLSPPVLSEPIQLLPHRELTVRRSPGHAATTVSGVGPGSSRPTIVQAELQVFEGSAAPASAADALIGPGAWRTIAMKTGALGSRLDLDIPQSGTRPLRIAVTETESYPNSPARLVYADIVPL